MNPELANELARTDAAELGARIKQARLKAGLTLQQAAGTDASAPYLSRIERGLRRPTASLLEALSKRLGVGLELLVVGDVPVDARRFECELDFAELALLAGDVDQAEARLAALAELETALKESTLVEQYRLLQARVLAARGDHARALSAFEDLVQAAQATSVFMQAALGLSRLLRETGDLTRSANVAEAALTRIDEGGGATDDVVRFSVTLAATLYESGETTRALAICRRAVAVSERAGSPRARAAAYWNTAIIESEMGSLAEALTLARRALALLEFDEDARLQARLRTQLGEFLLLSDPPEVAEAMSHLNAARGSFAFTDADPADVLHNRMAIARAHFAGGDLDEARAEAERCLADGRSLPFVAATAATLLGQVCGHRGDFGEAREYYVEAIQFLTSVGADRRAAQLWFDLAVLLDQVGLDSQAKDAFRRAAISTGLAQQPARVPAVVTSSNASVEDARPNIDRRS